MKRSILSSLLLSLSLLCAPALAETGTTLDSNRNISFIFGNNSQSSIKIAPRFDHPKLPLLSCNGKNLEGTMRYNGHLTYKTIEYCNGTHWVALSGKMYNVGDNLDIIDYKDCVDARNLGRTYYQQFGASGKPKVSLLCPRNYVIVGSDNMPQTNTHRYDAALCCKLRIQ